jgi:hypothetical protein
MGEQRVAVPQVRRHRAAEKGGQQYGAEHGRPRQRVDHRADQQDRAKLARHACAAEPERPARFEHDRQGEQLHPRIQQQECDRQAAHGPASPDSHRWSTR